VFHLNPLDAARDRAPVGVNQSTGAAAAPKPGLVRIVQKVVQAPAAIAHSIRDALKPHQTEQSASEEEE
jgi:hypothetical protein